MQDVPGCTSGTFLLERNRKESDNVNNNNNNCDGGK